MIGLTLIAAGIVSIGLGVGLVHADVWLHGDTTGGTGSEHAEVREHRMPLPVSRREALAQFWWVIVESNREMWGTYAAQWRAIRQEPTPRQRVVQALGFGFTIVFTVLVETLFYGGILLILAGILALLLPSTWHLFPPGHARQGMHLAAAGGYN